MWILYVAQTYGAFQLNTEGAHLYKVSIRLTTDHD